MPSRSSCDVWNDLSWRRGKEETVVYLAEELDRRDAAAVG
jgi:hypothetical protein